jgi:hypothetical protein
MSELIEQLAKEHELLYGKLTINAEYAKRLEAFAKAYQAKTQGKSESVKVSEKDKYPEKCNQSPFHCSYPECGCGR